MQNAKQFSMQLTGPAAWRENQTDGATASDLPYNIVKKACEKYEGVALST
ncbi:hypothetical protein [Bacillus chungangensis]|uniref:Uncharacterized protein n=1 Tax=Bacillus chungangensis TaxID=587633 RepID=A0ABT9WQB5_9BACI|nr:hypothetical protein [Bacillus chungangensis]MDQ0175480.1 hypothetical protein [Bacillus chungangensis]